MSVNIMRTSSLGANRLKGFLPILVAAFEEGPVAGVAEREPPLTVPSVGGSLEFLLVPPFASGGAGVLPGWRPVRRGWEDGATTTSPAALFLGLPGPFLGDMPGLSLS
jgi:hypothetical protein